MQFHSSALLILSKNWGGPSKPLVLLFLFPVGLGVYPYHHLPFLYKGLSPVPAPLCQWWAHLWHSPSSSFCEIERQEFRILHKFCIFHLQDSHLSSCLQLFTSNLFSDTGNRTWDPLVAGWCPNHWAHQPGLLLVFVSIFL